MKNQFFADKHDYFKYDLWLEIAEKVKGIRKLTFIPMLTPNREPRPPYPLGKRRERLYRFLQSCLAPQGRSVTRLRQFLCREPFGYHPYRDDDDKGFQDGSWDGYFVSVPLDWLTEAAILVDPDTGLEPTGDSRRNKPEHVTYKNVAQVVARCSKSSVVLVVQFLVWNAHFRKKLLQRRSQQLHKKLCSDQRTRVYVSWLAEKTNHGLGNLAFFAIGVGSETSKRLDKVLRKYAKTHGLACGAS